MITSKLYAVASVPGFCRRYKKWPSLLQKSDIWSRSRWSESRNVSSGTCSPTRPTRSPVRPPASAPTPFTLLGGEGDAIVPASPLAPGYLVAPPSRGVATVAIPVPSPECAPSRTSREGDLLEWIAPVDAECKKVLPRRSGLQF